jgi:peptidoglycan/LPS O-acetylase OafA/YrhL
MPLTLEQESKRRISSLDGLRGIAILLVIFWHFVPHAKFILGWTGVDLFFVLSGYLITQRLLATKERPNYLFQFYRNRALRIFPLYYGFLICFFLLIHFFVSPQHLPNYAGYLVHWKSFFLFTDNWTFIHYPFPNNLSLVPLWSIAVEMQFYLIWPFIILLTPSPKFRLITFLILLAAVIAVRIVYTLRFPERLTSIYYNTFFRMDGFLMGSFLCQLHETPKKNRNFPTRRILPVLALILLILIAVPLATHEAGPANLFFSLIGYPLLALFFTLILHLALQPQNLMPFLNNKFLQLSGRISYCLYIIHVPLLIALGSRLVFLGSSIWPTHPDLINWVTILIILLLTYAISIFSYRCFESYFLRLKT